MLTATWGDTVRVKASAPVSMRPGRLAAVVGMRDVETQEQVIEFEAAIGSKVYLIEFGDGDAIEVAETWLEAVVA